MALKLSTESHRTLVCPLAETEAIYHWQVIISLSLFLSVSLPLRHGLCSHRNGHIPFHQQPVAEWFRGHTGQETAAQTKSVTHKPPIHQPFLFISLTSYLDLIHMQTHTHGRTHTHTHTLKHTLVFWTCLLCILVLFLDDDSSTLCQIDV